MILKGIFLLAFVCFCIRDVNAVSCVILPTIQSSTDVVSGCGGTENSTCTLQCKTGYIPPTTGQQWTSFSCTQDGVYIYPIGAGTPTCIDSSVRCTIPLGDNNAATIVSGCDTTPLSTCTVKCSDGWVTNSGLPTWTSTQCTANGPYVFNPSWECTRTSCSVPNISNTEIVSGTCNGKKGDTCQLQCKTGYIPGNQVWISDYCQENTDIQDYVFSQDNYPACADPQNTVCQTPVVENGVVVTGCGGTPLSTCAFTCIEGFQGYSDLMTSRQCIESGFYQFWTTPICIGTEKQN